MVSSSDSCPPSSRGNQDCNDSRRFLWAHGAACQAAAEWRIYSIDICPELVVRHCFDLKEGMNDSLKPGSRSRLVWVSPCSRVWFPRTKFSPARLSEARWGTSNRPYCVCVCGGGGGREVGVVEAHVTPFCSCRGHGHVHPLVQPSYHEVPLRPALIKSLNTSRDARGF